MDISKVYLKWSRKDYSHPSMKAQNAFIAGSDHGYKQAIKDAVICPMCKGKRGFTDHTGFKPCENCEGTGMKIRPKSESIRNTDVYK